MLSASVVDMVVLQPGRREPGLPGPGPLAVVLCAFALLAAACGQEAATTVESDQPTPQPAPDDGSGLATTALEATASLAATCGPVRFSSIPPDLDEFPVLDAEAEQALVDLTTGEETRLEADFLEADDRTWSIAHRSDTELVLFGGTSDPAVAFTDGAVYARFDRSDATEAFRPGGWGGCRIEVESATYGNATIAFDPNRPPDPSSTELPLLINERNCASGRAPTDRDVLPVVTESDSQIVIVVLVEPAGDADCPGNPWHPITVTLDAPLGDRTVLDGHTSPPVTPNPATAPAADQPPPTMEEPPGTAPMADQPPTSVEQPPATVLPDQPLHDACVEPPGSETADALGLLSVEPSVVSAGQTLTFRWDVEGRGAFTTGDEMIVECWNGQEWTPVWYTFGAFADEPLTVVLTPSTIEDWGFTADGFSHAVGTVQIPDEAPPGTYRLTFYIAFGADDSPADVVDADAWFVVAD
jgi:hypothetical protein